MKNHFQYLFSGKVIYCIILCTSLSTATGANAQIQANAVNADPAVVSIEQIPSGSNISGIAVLRFKFVNDAASINSTGSIPPNSIRLTISFPGEYAFLSTNAIPGFVLEDAETTAYGVVHLVNNTLLLEGQVVDLLLNVQALASGTGDITFNVDRITPVIVGNVETDNDNVFETFVTGTVLPIQYKSFDVKKQGCTANIAWSIGNNEGEAGGFEIETNNGIDAAGFQKIGTVPCNKGKDSYNFDHVMQGNAVYLFRVKMINKDGNVTYSPIVSINSSCSEEGNRVQLYPSPAISVVTLNIYDTKLIGSYVRIFDLSGKELIRSLITGTVMKIDIAKLPTGIYLLKLVDGTVKKMMKE